MPIKFDNLLKSDEKKKSGINLNKLLGKPDFKPIPKKEIEFTPTNQEILGLGLGPIRPELAKKVMVDNGRVEILRKPRAWDETVEEPKLSPYDDTVKAYEDAWARADLNRLINTPAGKITAKDVLKEYEGKPEKILPFLSGAKDIQELVKLRGAIKRAETNETTPQDDLLLFKYAQESQRDRTFGGTVTSILMGLPSFAGEFLLTGGTYAAGKKAAEKALEKTFAKYTTKNLSKNVGTKILTGLAGASLQTPLAGLTRIPAGTLQNMLPEYNVGKGELGTLQFDITQPGDTLSLALAKAYGDQWVELVSERSGAIPGELGKIGIFSRVNKSVRDGLIKTGLLKSFLKANPGATPQVFNQWVKRAGWNGIIAEMGEERVGEGMRAILGLEEYKAPTPEQLAAELVAFGIPGTAINALGKVDATTEVVPQKQDTPIINQTDTTIPSPAASSAAMEPTNNLEQEARKYKSAEDFINNVDREALEIYKQQKIDAGEKFSFSDFTPGEFKSKKEWAEKIFKPQLTDIWNKVNTDVSKMEFKVEPTTTEPTEKDVALNTIIAEFDLAEAGSRPYMAKDGTMIKGKPSSFPDWLPDHLRNKKLLGVVGTHLMEGTQPTKSIKLGEKESSRVSLGQQKELYELVQDRINGVGSSPKLGELGKMEEMALFPGATTATEPKTLDDNLREMAKSYTEEAGRLAETKPVDIEGVQRKSRAYDRVRDQISEAFRDDVNYNQMDIGQQAAMAINFVNNNPTLALDVARGIKPPPPDIAATAISIAAAEQAKERGDDKLRSELIQRKSLRLTRYGQEIVLERMVDPDSADYFINLALKNKLNADASWTWDEKGSPVKRKAVLETAKKEARVARKTIDRRAAKIASAQKIIDSILC